MTTPGLAAGALPRTLRPPTLLPMTPSAILETVLYATDLAAAEAFWRDIFGLRVVRRLAGKFVFLRCGAGMLLVFDPVEAARPDPDNPIPRHGAQGPGHVCFRAADRAEIDAWAAHFRRHGIAIEAEHTWPGGGRSVYVRDPAGNSVEVAEGRIWAP